MSTLIRATGERGIPMNTDNQYIQIKNTNFVYKYKNDQIWFKSGKTSPLKLNKAEYSNLMSRSGNALLNYLLDTFENQNNRWLARKLIDIAHTGEYIFFDLNVEDSEACQAYVNTKKPQTKPFVEPEINNMIKAALKRTNPAYK